MTYKRTGPGKLYYNNQLIATEAEKPLMNLKEVIKVLSEVGKQKDVNKVLQELSQVEKAAAYVRKIVMKNHYRDKVRETKPEFFTGPIEAVVPDMSVSYVGLDTGEESNNVGD